MYSLLRFFYLFLIIIIVLSSCQEAVDIRKEKKEKSSKYDSLIAFNQKFLVVEGQQIDDYVDRHGWKVKKSGTGLRYLIENVGNGAKAEQGKTVKFNYTVRFLTGDICYSSKLDGPKSFVISRSSVESGLNEGILMLKVGGYAKFILPSHLAFGVTGDYNKIPPRAVLVYEVEILEIK